MLILGLEAVATQHPKRFNVCCPMCIHIKGKEDYEFKMGIAFDLNAVHCFRCGYSNSVKRFKAELNIEFENNKTLDDLTNKINDLSKPREDVKNNDIDLNTFTKELNPKTTPNAINYLKNRCITDEEIIKYSIKAGKSFKEIVDGKEKTNYLWSDRIVFPFYENNVFKYAVGRTYTNNSRRYMNTAKSRKGIVYGIDFIEDTCILCEGIISSIAASRYTGIPSVATLGCEINNLQIDKIRNKCNEVFLCFDGGLEKKILDKVILNLKMRMFKLWLVTLPDGFDPDDLKEDFKKYFNNAKKVSLL